jgi:hypothetical protein
MIDPLKQNLPKRVTMKTTRLLAIRPYYLIRRSKMKKAAISATLLATALSLAALALVLSGARLSLPPLKLRPFLLLEKAASTITLQCLSPRARRASH